MKRFEKRMLSLLLCAVLLICTLPMGMISAAAEGVDTSSWNVAGVTLRESGDDSTVFEPTDVTADGFTMEYNGSLVYALPLCGSSVMPAENVVNMAITPDSSNDRIISFDYDPWIDAGNQSEYNQYIAIGLYDCSADGEYFSGLSTDDMIKMVAGHAEYRIPAAAGAHAGEYKTVQFRLLNKTGVARLVVKNVKLTTVGGDYADNVTVSAAGKGTGDVVMTTTDDGVQLHAAPADDSAFIAYLDKDTGYVMSSDADYTFSPAPGTEVIALFGPEIAAADANFRIGCTGSGYCYTETLDEALAMVRYFSDKTIILNNDYTLDKDYSIPADVTLVIPERPGADGTCKLYTSDPHIVDQKAVAANTGAYKCLTLDTGVQLEVKGTLYIGGSMYVNSTASHAMTGRYGVLFLKAGSTVNMTGSSKLYAWGYVIGNGQINAASGSKTYEMLQICDWRAGTGTVAALMGGAFPFVQFYVQNIESKIVFAPGAEEIVLGEGDLMGMSVAVSLPFIGSPGSSLFSVQNGSITKYVGLTWDDDDDVYPYQASGDKKLHIDISGSAQVTSFPLVNIFAADQATVQQLITSAFESGGTFADLAPMALAMSVLNTSCLSIPISNMSIKLESESYLSTDQSLSIIPGSEIIIGEGSLFELNASIIAYDADTWYNYYGDSAIHFTGKKGKDLVRLQHSPSYEDTRAESPDGVPSVSSHIVIDGTMVVNDGIQSDIADLMALMQSFGNLNDYITEYMGALQDMLEGGDIDLDYFQAKAASAQFIREQFESITLTGNTVQDFAAVMSTDLMQYYLGMNSYNDNPTLKQKLINAFDFLRSVYAYKSEVFNSVHLWHYTFATSYDIESETSYSDVVSSGTGTVIINSKAKGTTFRLSTDYQPASGTLVGEIIDIDAQPAWLKNGSGAADQYSAPSYDDYEYKKYIYSSNVWTPVADDDPTTTVSWFNNSGDWLGNTAVNAGETPVYPSPVITDSTNNYTFTGWADNPSSYYLKGGFNNWGQSDPFVWIDDNRVAVTKELAQGSYTFKIYYPDDVWFGNNGTITDTTTTTAQDGWDMSTSDGDCTLSATGGTYTFIFNTSNNILIILKDEGSVAFVSKIATYDVSPKSYSVTLYDENNTVIGGQAQDVEAGTTPDVSLVPDVKGTGKNAKLFSHWVSGEDSYGKYELPVTTGNSSYTAVYTSYYDHDTLSLFGTIGDNIYFKKPTGAAGDAAVYYYYTLPETGTTRYRAASMDSSGTFNEATILLPPAELTYDLVVTYRVGDLCVDYIFEGVDYAERLFASDAAAQEGCFYLVGTINGENCWADHLQTKYKMTQNSQNTAEYVLWNVKLYENDQIKGYKYSGSQAAYYPDGSNYTITATGYYNVYVSTTPNNGPGWHETCLLVQEVSADNFDSYNAAFAKQVTSALMNYATKAQNYFNRNIDDPANDHVNGNIYTYDDTATDLMIANEAVLPANANGLDPVKVDLKTDAAAAFRNTYGMNYYGSTYLLNSGTILRHYFRVYNNAKVPESVEFKCGDTTVTANAVWDNDYYVHYDYAWVGNKGIPGAELNDPVTVNFGNGTLYSYSFYCYAQNIFNKTANELIASGVTDVTAFKALIRSIYWYNKEADAYFTQANANNS